MNIQRKTKKALIAQIAELEALVHHLRLEKDEEARLDFAWAGNLGHWYWNYTTNQVRFNPLKALTLGFTQEEVPETVSHQFFSDRLHPDDYERVMEAMRQHLKGATPVHEVEYRIQAKDGSWRWFYDIGKVTQRDADGKPVFLAGIVFDITGRKELQQKLEDQNRLLQELAIKDGLTNLLNHRAIVSRLDEEIVRAQRYPMEFSILLLDIDHFKRVNDTYGHPQGDIVLKEVAKTLQRQIRDIDAVGRYGGEEFLILFPNTSPEDAYNAAERIRMAVLNLQFEQGLKISISGGLAQFGGRTAEDMVAAADKCLYQAKHRGRNQIVKCVMETTSE